MIEALDHSTTEKAGDDNQDRGDQQYATKRPLPTGRMLSSSRRGRFSGGGWMPTRFACIRKSSIIPRRSQFGLSQA